MKTRNSFILIGSTLVGCLLPTSRSFAGQIDVGPPDGHHFGRSLTLLPSGNFVASGTDASFLYKSNGSLLGILASREEGVDTKTTALPNGNVVISIPNQVLLYRGDGELISTLTDPTQAQTVDDIVVLGNGNFVALNAGWNGNAGAATWMDAEVGLSGHVSATNSLVGDTPGTRVGEDAVSLANSDFVVISDKNAVGSLHGATTWGDGNLGLRGVASAKNSLIETGRFPSVHALAGSRFVTSFPAWNGGRGASTWEDGANGPFGSVSAGNSLVGSAPSFLAIGERVVLLANGNYVVTGFNTATWGNGNSGITGIVDASNSFIGVQSVIPLTNGNYVIANSVWNSPTADFVGAVTWADGSRGATGVATEQNSLIGSTYTDYVGGQGVVTLTNGNYVVVSEFWNNGAATSAGAVTWGNGATGTAGVVSIDNSLVGTTKDDSVGAVTRLSNGNYVVAASSWNNGASARCGAVTWGDGTRGVVGAVSTQNSFVGSSAEEGMGIVAALADGNFVVGSPGWSNGSTEHVGAVTWADGTRPIIGAVIPANSLIGSRAGDGVGSAIIPLGNDYVVVSPQVSTSVVGAAGAITHMQPGAIGAGIVSSSNSLVGASPNDYFALTEASGTFGDVYPVGSGSYVIWAPFVDNGDLTDAGAFTLVSAGFPVTGPVSTANSILGHFAQDAFNANSYVYDEQRNRLIVLLSYDDIVSIFDPDLIFSTTFE